jgi:hypothetical protein
MDAGNKKYKIHSDDSILEKMDDKRRDKLLSFKYIKSKSKKGTVLLITEENFDKNICNNIFIPMK